MGEAEGEEEMGMAELDPAFQTFLEDMERYNTIGVEDVNTMLAEDPESVFLLDVRQPSELEENGWIEGAVNIPLREVAASVEYLPAFDQTIVSYCGSGWRCTIALTALEAMGWEDVLGLTGGSFGAWVEAGYPIVEGEVPEPEALNAAEPDPEITAEMDEMLANVPEGYGVITADDLFMLQGENPDLILIDVRREEELEENGVIEWENQVHIPLEEFVAMQEQWPEDMDAQIVTYCGSGHRSTIAMTILWSYGYSDVHSLKGGFRGWNEAGYPVVEYTAP
jgi:rhodanese-related sulfurtransferase